MNIIEFFFLGIILFAFAICFEISVNRARNRSMDDANGRYRSAVDEANNAVFAANDKLRELKEAIKESNNPIDHLDTIVQMRTEYLELLKKAESKHGYAKASGNAAYAAYVRGVTIQNLFLGGANSLSMFSLNKRYKEYSQTGGFYSLDNPSEVLVKIERYLTIAQITGIKRTNTHQALPHPESVQESRREVSAGITSDQQQSMPEPGITKTRKGSPFRLSFVLILVAIIMLVGGVCIYQKVVLKNDVLFHFYPAAQSEGQRHFESTVSYNVPNTFSHEKNISKSLESASSDNTDHPKKTVSIEQNAIPEQREISYEEGIPYKVIRKDGLTLRSTADISSKRISRVRKGETVYAIDDNIVSVGKKGQHWRKVRDSAANIGWIISDYLEPICDD